MISGFLDIVSKDLYERYGNKMADLCLVFPNRRARLFFAQSLSRIISEPLWQPSYSSMDDFVKQSVALQVADNFPLLLTLYESYSSIRKTDEPFDRFYYWGSMMLSDFDIVDKYRIDASALFSNLRFQKELEGDFSFLDEEQLAAIRSFWGSFQPEGKSTLQQQFLEIWDILLPTYNDFKERLTAKNMAYDGMLYRLLADHLESGEAPIWKGTQEANSRFVFIGFNALNECEKAIFRHLQKQGRADFYWDYDPYYVNDLQQEAGLSLRENMAAFPSPLQTSDYSVFKEEKTISIVATPSDAVQSKLVPAIMEQMAAAADVSTAIVLSDEKLLIPLLHALPAAASNINVTMGYPLRNTAVFSLLNLLLKMLRNAKADKQNRYRFYYRDILAILYHPYINLIDNKNIKKEINNIVLFNNIYVYKFKFIDNQILNVFFEKPQNFTELTDRLVNILEEVERKGNFPAQDPMISGYIQHSIRRLFILKKAMEESPIDFSLPVYIRVLQNHIKNETIPFSGEPLIGLQVLGLLETRCLDFENVILLSANEGTLPKALNTSSFIPYNLRKAFGLPTVEQHEAVYAYSFYRLLQRAKHITLVYNTKTDDARSGEASRYLLQLKLESGHQVHEQSVSFNLGVETPEAISVSKTAEVMVSLYRFFDMENHNLFSPSALNTYIACPLQFYYKYVARIKEPDRVEEDINNQLLGKVLHASMERLYIPYLSKSVTADALKFMSRNEALLNETVDAAMAGVFFDTNTLPADALEDGKLLILKNVTKKYVRQVIKIDQQVAPFMLEGLEMKLEQPISLLVDGQTRRLTVGGIIDRMDRTGERLRIVDYKTTTAGQRKEKRSMLSVASLFKPDEKLQRKELLQAMFYAVMLKQQQATQSVKPLLYFLHDAFEDNADFSIIDTATGQLIDDVGDYVVTFMEELELILAKIFDSSTPFTQTKNEKICEYCPYKSLCGK